MTDKHLDRDNNKERNEQKINFCIFRVSERQKESEKETCKAVTERKTEIYREKDMTPNKQRDRKRLCVSWKERERDSKMTT